MAPKLKIADPADEARKRTQHLIGLINATKDEIKTANEGCTDALKGAKENHGDDPAMLKLAAKFCRMEGIDGRMAFVKLQQYLDHMQFFNQSDLLDDVGKDQPDRQLPQDRREAVYGEASA